MKRIMIICLLACTAFAFSATTATAQKVAFVSYMDVLESMSDVKVANSKLATLEEQLNKQAEAMVTKARNKAQKAQEDSDKGLLTAKDIARIESELLNEELEIQKFAKSAQDDLIKKRNELFEPIALSIKEAIDAISADRGLNYVFDSSLGAILFAEENLDITEAVKSQLAQ